MSRCRQITGALTMFTVASCGASSDPEAAELMEHFLWVDNDASRQMMNDPVKMAQIANEMADVGCYLLAMANTLGVDLSEAIVAKLAKNVCVKL